MREINIFYVAALTLLIAGFLTTEVASFGCYSCWSNVTAECAVGPVVNAPREECPEDDLSCVTAIVDEKTVRGCSNSLSLPADYPMQETCSFEYCNSNIYPTDRLYCFKCQGSECSAAPKGKSRPCLNYSPNDECYTDVINATYTFRGCLSDGNYTATEYTTMCKADLCNNQPYAETLECLSCNSNDTLDCIRLADGSGECQISLNSTCSQTFLLGRPASCYTYQDADYVERGCGKPTNTVGTIDYENVCSENNCNAECISQSVCYTCDSTVDPNCSTDLSNFEPENCTIQAISPCFTCLGKVDNDITFRGCSSSLPQASKPALSSSCQDEYCNLEIYPTNRLSCFKCSGPDCSSAPSGNSRPCVNYDPNDKCYTKVVNATDTIRGCLSDGNFTVSAQTILCNGDMCNKDASTGGTCFECNSKFGDNCYENANETSVAICDDGEDVHTCFTCINHSDFSVTRGCGNSSANSTYQCTTCNDYDCNSDSVLECYQCSSDDVDNCNRINSTTASTLCLANHCIARITETGVTERGCHSESFDCVSTDLHCNKCNESLCNDEPTPVGSFKCHECDGESCMYLNGTADTLQICAALGTGECYQYFDMNTNNSAGSMVRGCMGDNNTANCLAAEDDCYRCRKSGCNDVPFLRPNNLTCIKCRSVEECLWGYNASSGSPCNGDTLIYWEQAYCYIALSETTATRGCSSDLYQCPGCDMCTSDNCNSANLVWQKCLQCSSNESDSCEDGSYPETRCPGDVITYEERGCYMMKTDYSVTRGCGIHSTNSNDECTTCNDNNCNYDPVMECYECSSEDVDNCHQVDSKTVSTLCLTNHCLTKLTDTGVIRRGCHSDSFDCDPDDLYCTKCPESLCNNESLPNKSFKCHVCNETTSQCSYLNGTDTLKLCSVLGVGACYQYFDLSGKMIRGCYGDDNTESCLATGESCHVCRTSGCNDVPLTRSNNLTCIKCQDADECPWGFDESRGSSCDFDVMYYQEPVCFTGSISILNIVARGCLPSKLQCPALGATCLFCNTNNCNTANVAWQQCLQCSSQESDKCADGTYNATNCPGKLLSYEQSGCYMMQSDGAMSRGCGTDIDQDQCWTCTDGDGCNNKTLNQCYSCNSATDRSCVLPDETSGTTNTTLCNGECIEKIVNATIMIRGCESLELNCNDTDPNSFCHTCDGHLCNSASTPLGTLKCHQCNTVESCNEFNDTSSEAIPCMLYEPDDQCVQFYNGSAMMRGCASSSVGEQCDEMGMKCLKCDTSGCNDVPLERPGGMFCIQCSAEDYCAWGFNHVEGTLCTNPVLYYQNESCYTSTDNETTVIRGCTTTDAVGCNATDLSCQFCSGENCNNENIIRQFCIQCSSRLDANCSLEDTTLNATVCPAEIQTYENRGCYVRREVDGHTFRGCESNTPPDHTHISECDTSEYCNSLIFPTNRLRCYKCEGANCFSPYGNTRVCVNYDENELCYSNVFNDKNVTRGCMSDGNVTMTDFLVTCDYNSCNNGVAISTLNCIKCSSEDDKDCVRNPEPEEESCKIPVADTCTVFPLLGRNDSCYVKRSGDLVKRGCSSVDLEGDETYENLEQCRTNVCNTQCIPEAVCYQCNSTNDPNCGGNLSLLKPERCEDHGLSTCYSCLSEDGVITRGCGSSNLPDGCAVCDNAAGCNNDEMNFCYTCSSDTDPNCAQLTAVDQLPTEVCSTQCITKITGKTTLRGCAKENLSCGANDPHCESCVGDRCNSKLLPANRLQCFHCDGSTPCLNVTRNEISLTCANYDAADKCMAYLSGNKIIRGCFSDSNGNECIAAGARCLTCDGNNCNGVPLLREPEQSCIACDYSLQCAWGFRSSEGRRCQGNVAFYQTESCYTHIFADGRVSRGCTLEAGCDPTTTNCTLCDGNNCNNQNVEFQNCLQCNSASSSECYKESDGSAATKCPGDIHTYAERGCFAMRKDDTTRRGCIAQLSVNDLNLCKSDESIHCALCYEQSCNKDRIPNSSTLVKSSATAVCLAVIFTIFNSFYTRS